MTDPQNQPTPLRQEREAQQETEAEYWDRYDKHIPREWRCAKCHAVLANAYCPDCKSDESEE